MNTGMTKNCALCRSEKIQKIFVSRNKHGRHLIDAQDSFDVFICLECRCIFLGALEINDEYYKKYYELGYYENARISLLSQLLELFSRFLVWRKERLILAHLKKKKDIALLDVGCGEGSFLLKLNGKKFLKSGVEINQEGVDFCRKKGLRIYHQKIREVNFEGKQFEVITMWHVLEHLTDPVETLKKIRTILSDTGLFIFEVPNADSLGFKYGQADWFHLDSPRHLILYNKKSAQRLCELSGFRVVALRSSFLDYPLDLFWSVRKSPIRYLVYPFYPLAKLLSRETLTFVCKKAATIDNKGRS